MVNIQTLAHMHTLPLAQSPNWFFGIGRLAFPEPNNSSLRKIAKLEDPAPYSRLGLVVRFLNSFEVLNFFQFLSTILNFSAKESRSGHEPAC